MENCVAESSGGCQLGTCFLCRKIGHYFSGKRETSFKNLHLLWVDKIHKWVIVVAIGYVTYRQQILKKESS